MNLQDQPDTQGPSPIAGLHLESGSDQGSTDVPLQEEIKESDLPDKICTPCLERNLIEPGVCETFLKCNKCGEEFCIHGVSKLDPQYCIQCCNNFKIVDVVETVQRPVFNLTGELLAVQKFKVRHITLSGKHWLFFNRQISSLTDVELDHAIEYHQSIYHGMIYEREGRFVKKIQRNKGKVAGNEQNSLTGSVASPFIQTENGMQFVTTSQKASKILKTRRARVSQSQAVTTSNNNVKAQAKVDDLIKTLLKAGMTMEQIAAIGKK